jgi:hypothetical protein
MRFTRTYAIPFVAIIGVLVLFAFPEPQTNLIAYLATMFAFGVLIVLTVRWSNRG